MKYRPLDIKGSVLLLGESEDLVYIDRRMLAACGARRSLFVSSGLKAARMLGDLNQDDYPEFVFCTGPADMESLHFLEILRLHPNMRDLPMIIVVNQLEQQQLVEASRLGSCVFLARPYTQQEMENAVSSMNNERCRLAACENTSLFEQALESLEAELEAQDEAARSAFLILGKSLLRQGRQREAVVAFARHLEEGNGKRADALLGVGEALSALGKHDMSVHYLSRAAAAYIEEEDFMGARAVFSRLQKEDKQTLSDNPLYQAGIRLASEGSYHAAIQAFMQGQMLTPELPFHSYAAEACQAAPNPGHCAERICCHLERRSPSQGRSLRGYLLPEMGEGEFEPRPGLWGLLREVVEVARYTARVNAAG
ncbi:MAG: hypothetical protein IJD04_00530 [Desulfovibrionaceae bacterium]|nr:hypothetical protein [Desulfovibrionaceae bacterium]